MKQQYTSAELSSLVTPAGMPVVAQTDDGQDGAYAAVRAAGIEVAQRCGAELILLDRTSASWFTDPRRSGPWTADVSGPGTGQLIDVGDLRLVGRAYLEPFVDQAERAGVRTYVWLQRQPGVRGIREAARTTRAGLVLVPADKPLDDRNSDSIQCQVGGGPLGVTVCAVAPRYQRSREGASGRPAIGVVSQALAFAAFRRATESSSA